jgi:hypothetical protein
MTDNYLECISILVSAINKSEYIPTHVLKWNEIDAFFNSHRIIPLLSSWVKEYRTIVPTHILENWRKRIYQSIYYVSNYYAVQDKVVSLFESANIPFLILKGTSSGRYYPDPRFRTYGDIDLYFRDEDVHRACTCVSQNGYAVDLDINKRHYSFAINGTNVEMHRYFAVLNDPCKANYLDNLLLTNINNSTHCLPDLENGIIILQHINQHLEKGLGLRQIIDWFFFVDKVLDDQFWMLHFQKEAEAVGLEQLALITTKMCKKYLGLKASITWCECADEELCDEFMQYVLDCGNFGNNKHNMIGEELFTKSKNPKQAFSLLLKRYGDYSVCERVKVFVRVIIRKLNLKALVCGIRESKMRKNLLEKLNAKQTAKGIAKYQDGIFSNERFD